MEKREKMKMSDRAKIFLPFNGLRGYYDLILKANEIKEDKKELSEEELDLLNNILNKLEKRMMVKIKYYDIDKYKEIEGMISKIDYVNQYIMIVKTKISFDNLYLIEIL